MEEKKNPWLGLESYQEGEVLYGRDDDIRDLIQCIINDIDTLLYGKSGIGKSSLLNAGIFPAARRKGFLPVLVRLSHKENCNYLSQINDAIIAATGLAGNDRHEIQLRIREVIKCKDPQSETLYEFFHRHTFHDEDGKRIKLLIVFDQFEEIFTLQTDEAKKRSFFAQMADLLNDIMPDGLHPKSEDVSVPKELVNTESDSSSDIFDNIDIDSNDDFPEYINDNDTHFVFTIREDFLSELEYYTSSIPSLKQNRYALRPINEEQASQIILNPEPNLISPSVARLIIEKVTGRTDFKLDGIPEINVDSAVLSLYLNRLYASKGSDGITADLIEQRGEEIISDFYSEAMADISDSSVEYIEDKLINGQGRRDNITVFDAIHKGGVTHSELNILCNERKILRQFNYAGVLRIEYIHDILCPIVIKHRENRQQRKLEEESKKLIQQQELHTRKLKKRNKIISIFACLLLVISIVASFLFFSKPQTSKITVLLSEDDSINLTDYWKARVTFISGSDTLCVADVDKSNPMFAFDVKDSDLKKMRCDVFFLIGDFVVSQEFDNSVDDNFEITIPITHNTNRTLIKGVVASRIGSKAPIYHALVIIDNQLAKTNYKGEFAIYVDSVPKDSTIIIIKKGYKSYEGKLSNKVYRLNLNGDYTFPDLANNMQQRLNDRNNIRTLEGSIYVIKEKDTISGRAHMTLELSHDSILGYTYFDRSYKRETNKINSYFLINGVFNSANNTFKLHLMDAVYNEMEYTGYVNKDSIWYGESFDKNRKIGYFIFKESVFDIDNP